MDASRQDANGTSNRLSPRIVQASPADDSSSGSEFTPGKARFPVGAVPEPLLQARRFHRRAVVDYPPADWRQRVSASLCKTDLRDVLSDNS